MRATLLALTLLLAACAAPSQQPDAGTGATGTTRPAQPASAAPAATPVVAQPAAAGPTVKVDTSCKVDADCVVKDVGNCCGAFPACVNRGSPTDPAGVRAACSAAAQASVCGFNEINACHCVRGHCAAEREPVGGWTDDPPAPKPESR